uniref:Uncharacterized protein n=1 Tax=Streptomyces sp. NBC_00003 TaxID=2903608 RepID=A0AAU2UVT0_9ACTN
MTVEGAFGSVGQEDGFGAGTAWVQFDEAGADGGAGAVGVAEVEPAASGVCVDVCHGHPGDDRGSRLGPHLLQFVLCGGKGVGGAGAVFEDRAGTGAAYVEQGADGGRSGSGAGVFQDAQGVGGAGEPGRLVGEVRKCYRGQVPVARLVGGVDGGLPVPLGIGVPVGVEAEPAGPMGEGGCDGVQASSLGEGAAVLRDEFDGGVQVCVDERGDGRAGPASHRVQLTGALLQPAQQFGVEAAAVQGVAEVTGLDAGPVRGEID